MSIAHGRYEHALMCVFFDAEFSPDGFAFAELLQQRCTSKNLETI